MLQSSHDCSNPTTLQCITHPIKLHECQSSVFILLKERKRLGDESNRALCLSPEKRRNLLLLIISLLQHSVSACNISPALLGWRHCSPTAPSSATINSSAREAEPDSACSGQHWGDEGEARIPTETEIPTEPQPEPAQDIGLLILVHHR